jgi:hypothetical protein
MRDCGMVPRIDEVRRMQLDFENADYKATLKAICDWYFPNKYQGPCQGDMFPRLRIKESWRTKSGMWEVWEVHEPDFYASNRKIASGRSAASVLRSAFNTLTRWKS